MSAAFIPCTGFPGYEVSSDGLVRSVTSNWRGYGQRELAQLLDEYGYPTVRLTIAKGTRKRVGVHRLVATAFLPPCPEGSDQTNNSAGNLAWGTAADNAADRSRHGRAAPITPEKREKMRAGYHRWLQGVRENV